MPRGRGARPGAPRVAMLSYASGDSNQGALIDTVREATAKAKSLCSEYPIEGPIQFDAAVDADVAAIKYKGSDSEVAGCVEINQCAGCTRR